MGGLNHAVQGGGQARGGGAMRATQAGGEGEAQHPHPLAGEGVAARHFEAAHCAPPDDKSLGWAVAVSISCFWALVLAAAAAALAGITRGTALRVLRRVCSRASSRPQPHSRAMTRGERQTVAELVLQ